MSLSHKVTLASRRLLRRMQCATRKWQVAPQGARASLRRVWNACQQQLLCPSARQSTGFPSEIQGRRQAQEERATAAAAKCLRCATLPAADIGPYTAGVAAPILLGIFRVLQVCAAAAPPPRQTCCACLLQSRQASGWARRLSCKRHFFVCVPHQRRIQEQLISNLCLWVQGLALGGEYGAGQHC